MRINVILIFVFCFFSYASAQDCQDCYENKTISTNPLDPEINKVKLSLMADIYFDTLGADGKELNTVQVFTYELFDKEKELDKISEKGEWKEERKEVQKYRQGVITIKNEEITPTSPYVWEVIGTNIYIKAEHIKLEGELTVADGYKAIIEAFWDVEVNPTIDLSAIELTVKKDFYNFPASR